MPCWFRKILSQKLSIVYTHCIQDIRIVLNPGKGPNPPQKNEKIKHSAEEIHFLGTGLEFILGYLSFKLDFNQETDTEKYV